jgi:hypothetical protein
MTLMALSVFDQEWEVTIDEDGDHIILAVDSKEFVASCASMSIEHYPDDPQGVLSKRDNEIAEHIVRLHNHSLDVTNDD